MKYSNGVNKFLNPAFSVPASMVEMVMRFDEEKRSPLIEWIHNTGMILQHLEGTLQRTLTSIYDDLIVEETCQLHFALNTTIKGDLTKV